MIDPYKKITTDTECLKKKCLCTPVIIGPTGPQGPIGPAGPATISVGTTVTGNPGESASVTNSGTDESAILNFVIPQGPTGAEGPMGPIGPKGDNGVGDTIFVRSTTTGESGTDAKVIDNKIDNTHILDFVIPKGPIGPAGPTLLRSAYLVTFNADKSDTGVPVEPEARLPINRLELDVSNLLELDEKEGLIKFNVTGYYRVYFTVSAYPSVNDVEFDPTKDIVSVGFKETDTDNVYLGVGEWVYNAEPVELSACGIISVVDTAVTYELSNLGKYKIFLQTPDLTNLSSKSYFSNSLVTLVIDYLGRQGT